MDIATIKRKTYKRFFLLNDFHKQDFFGNFSYDIMKKYFVTIRTKRRYFEKEN